MRTIERTGRFKRDYKREAKGAHRATLQADLREVVGALVQDEPLAPRYRDHALTGDWADHRDCHIKPDLILIYRKPGRDTLQLVRLGSHAELGPKAVISTRGVAVNSASERCRRRGFLPQPSARAAWGGAGRGLAGRAKRSRGG